MISSSTFFLIFYTVLCKLFSLYRNLRASFLINISVALWSFQKICYFCSRCCWTPTFLAISNMVSYYHVAFFLVFLGIALCSGCRCLFWRLMFFWLLSVSQIWNVSILWLIHIQNLLRMPTSFLVLILFVIWKSHNHFCWESFDYGISVTVFEVTLHWSLQMEIWLDNCCCLVPVLCRCHSVWYTGHLIHPGFPLFWLGTPFCSFCRLMFLVIKNVSWVQFNRVFVFPPNLADSNDIPFNISCLLLQFDLFGLVW